MAIRFSRIANWLKMTTHPTAVRPVKDSNPTKKPVSNGGKLTMCFGRTKKKSTKSSQELNSGDETNHAESSLNDLNHSLTPIKSQEFSPWNEIVAAATDCVDDLFLTDISSNESNSRDGTLAYDYEESPYSLEVSVVDSVNPASQDASSSKIKSQELRSLDDGSQDASFLKDFNHVLTPYFANFKSQEFSSQNEIVATTDCADDLFLTDISSNESDSGDSLLAYDDEESPYSLDVCVVDAASQYASSPKIKSQEFREMGYCSRTLPYDDEVSTNSLELNSMDDGSQDASSLKDFNHVLTPYFANFKSQEFKGVGKSEVEVLRSERDLLNKNKEEQETEISRLKLLLEVKSNEVEKLKQLCVHQWGEIEDVRSLQSQFQQLVEKQGARLKQATQIIPTLQQHVSYLTDQNSQLQQLQEKQDSELKQAKQAIPALERLVISLKGENSQLQQLIEKQDLELKQANQVIPALERLVTSLTDQIKSLEIEDSSSGDSTTPSGPDDMFDPFCAMIQSQEFKKVGYDTVGDQQVEDTNLSVLEIPRGYFSDVSSYSSDSSPSAEVRNQKLREEIRAEVIAEDMKKTARKGRNLSGLCRKLSFTSPNGSCD